MDKIRYSVRSGLGQGRGQNYDHYRYRRVCIQYYIYDIFNAYILYINMSYTFIHKKFIILTFSHTYRHTHIYVHSCIYLTASPFVTPYLSTRGKLSILRCIFRRLCLHLRLDLTRHRHKGFLDVSSILG